MELMQNPTTGAEMGLIAPAGESWFIIFEYDQIGYVKDDDKDSLDSDLILESIRENTSENNKIRKEKGWETLEVLGWIEAPHYDEQTLSSYKALLSGYEFQKGQKYAEFRAGDKVAKYGLVALITGGAAAVLAKSGLLKHLWKFLVAGAAAVAAFLKRKFGKRGIVKNGDSGSVQEEQAEVDECDDLSELPTTEKTSEQWECPQCKHSNPGTTFICQNCDHKLV